jgi:hypothetical protein
MHEAAHKLISELVDTLDINCDTWRISFIAHIIVKDLLIENVNKYKEELALKEARFKKLEIEMSGLNKAYSRLIELEADEKDSVFDKVLKENVSLHMRIQGLKMVIENMQKRGYKIDFDVSVD